MKASWAPSAPAAIRPPRREPAGGQPGPAAASSRLNRKGAVMPFKIDEQVVYPAFGIGRIAALVTKSFFEAESQMYYEVTGDRSTVWVQVDESAARGLRRLTRPDEIAHYRGVVSGRPASLNQDHRQRQLELRGQLK